MPHFFLDFQKFSFCLDLYTALIHNGNVDANELMKASSTSWSFFGAKINLDLWCYAIYAVFLCRKSVAIQVFQVHAYTPPHTKKTQDYVIITSVLKVSYQKNYIFCTPPFIIVLNTIVLSHICWLIASEDQRLQFAEVCPLVAHLTMT